MAGRFSQRVEPFELNSRRWNVQHIRCAFRRLRLVPGDIARRSLLKQAPQGPLELKVSLRPAPVGGGAGFDVSSAALTVKKHAR